MNLENELLLITENRKFCLFLSIIKNTKGTSIMKQIKDIFSYRGLILVALIFLCVILISCTFTAVNVYATDEAVEQSTEFVEDDVGTEETDAQEFSDESLMKTGLAEKAMIVFLVAIIISMVVGSVLTVILIWRRRRNVLQGISKMKLIESTKKQ